MGFNQRSSPIVVNSRAPGSDCPCIKKLWQLPSRWQQRDILRGAGVAGHPAQSHPPLLPPQKGHQVSSGHGLKGLCALLQVSGPKVSWRHCPSALLQKQCEPSLEY